MRLAVAGGAGLVGQNLILRLLEARSFEIVAIDKHGANLAALRALSSDIEAIEADMAEPGDWEAAVGDCDALVMLQAQIGGVDPEPFRRNNIVSTERAMEAARRGGRCGYVLHVSSSVVNSLARDLYVESKMRQEAIVAASEFEHIILRPTLMFGWFDRKHLGWLSRFMARTPVFPVPGHGRYLRQPLYGGDFAAICKASLERRLTGAYNISGLEKVDYLDLVRLLKEVTSARAMIVRIPYGLFDALLSTYALFDRDPPFTTAQLAALVTPEVFEVIDWPSIFGVRATPLRAAFEETFRHPVYSKVELSF